MFQICINKCNIVYGIIIESIHKHVFYFIWHLLGKITERKNKYPNKVYFFRPIILFNYKAQQNRSV